MDVEPIQRVMETYPMICAIIQSSNNGCHLCPSITSAIMQEKPQVEIWEMFELKKFDNARIYTMLTLSSYPSSADAILMLTPHEGRLRSSDDWLKLMTQGWISLKR